jgi:hypothetical protein
VTLAALPSDVQTIWWVTLALGAVVALVVLALLHLLRSAVLRIERNAEVLWQTATTVARNTATTWLIGQTAETVEEIKKEALRHDAFLSQGTGSL